MKVLDIVVPHYSYEFLETCLKSIRRNTPPDILNRVILINGSGNNYNFGDLVDIQVNVKNQGFAKNCNTGIRLSDAKYVACANDDTVIFNKHWWEGIIDTFKDYPNALCVNPSSPCDPDGRGGTVIMDGYEYKEDYTDEEYNSLLKPYVIDGICCWFPIFNRELLDKVPGIIPGKAWFDELFYPGGAEDYDLNRRSYLAGMRCLGTNRSYVWHWWFKTRHPITGQTGVKFDGNTFDEKWGIKDKNGNIIERPDIYGNSGKKDIPQITIRND